MKFPYEVGRQGGGAFVLLYLLFVFLLGLPLMVAEMSIGLLGEKTLLVSYISKALCHS